MTKTVRTIGEFGLIEKIARWVGDTPRGVRGIGDDVAVMPYTKKFHGLLTTDILIEDVHFRLREATPYLIGKKALAVNISDIAAMGGVPGYALVSIGMPARTRLSFVRAVYQGIASVARQYGVLVVGGDTSRSQKIIINISIFGVVEKNKCALRSNAKPGDAILVTGLLGGSYASKRHLNVMPRVREARYLVAHGVRTMIDLSDGLASDLTRIIQASGVGAVIQESLIPVARGCTINNALYDGEDYELLFTVSQSRAQTLLKAWPYPTRLTRIGIVVDAPRGIWRKSPKGSVRISGAGYRHFR